MSSSEIAQNLAQIAMNPNARGRLLQVARRILNGNSEEAEDAFQDGIVQALSSSAGFRGDASPTTWMHRVVVNAALMRRRKARLASRLERPEHQLPDGAWLAGGAGGPAPDVQVERREQLELARRAVASLSDDYRDAVERCVLDDRNTVDVARELGITTGCLRTRTARARRQLESAVAA
jgi:RNA polymerase sigma-70 factor (ECF subfamily)